MSSRIVYTPPEPKYTRKKLPSRKRLMPMGILLILALLFCGGIALLRSKRFQITTIEFNGTKTLQKNNLELAIFSLLNGNYVLLIPRNSFFTVSVDRLSSSLQRQFPQIETLSIQKKFPHTLTVTIRERDFFAVFCPKSNVPAIAEATTSIGQIPPISPDENCLFLDRNGFSYDQAPNVAGSLLIKISKDIPVPTVGSQLLSPDLMQYLITLRDGLKQTLDLDTIRYKLKSRVPNEINVQTSEGFSLILNRTTRPENMFKVLKTLLEQEIKDKRSQLDYIDLRFGNKVFYKLKRK